MIVTISTLEVLDLSDNLITSVPDKIDNLQNLKFLSLANNTILNIPSSIGKIQYNILIIP